MKIITILTTLILVIALSSCEDHRPISTGVSQRTWSIKEGEKIIYYLNDLRYWSNDAELPTLAVISILSGETLASIPTETKTEEGNIVSIKINSDSGITELPLFDESLLKQELVPVYFSKDGRKVQVVNIAIADFKEFKQLVQDKNQDKLIEYLEKTLTLE